MCMKISLPPSLKWVRSVIMSGRPGLIIPGRWVMYEYYYEQKDKLLHIKEDQLMQKKEFWEIEFDKEGSFRQKSNIPVKFFENQKVCYWKLSGNYLIVGSGNYRETFQFAVTARQMRLLQKEKTGRIVFFGFFRKKLVE